MGVIKMPEYPRRGDADPNGAAAAHMHEQSEKQIDTNNPNGGSRRKKKYKGGNNVPAGKMEVNSPVSNNTDAWGHNPMAVTKNNMSALASVQTHSSQDDPNQLCTGGGLKRKKKSKKNKRKSKRKTKRKTKRKRKSKRKSKRKIKRK